MKRAMTRPLCKEKFADLLSIPVRSVETWRCRQAGIIGRISRPIPTRTEPSAGKASFDLQLAAKICPAPSYANCLESTYKPPSRGGLTPSPTCLFGQGGSAKAARFRGRQQTSTDFQAHVASRLTPIAVASRDPLPFEQFNREDELAVDQGTAGGSAKQLPSPVSDQASSGPAIA
jgi:hypothetical protein